MDEYSFLVAPEFLPSLSGSKLSTPERAIVLACSVLALLGHGPVSFWMLQDEMNLSERVFRSALRSLMRREVLKAFIPV